MKAVKRFGKNRGKEVKVMQWCNDWFMVDSEPSICTPSALLFDEESMLEVIEHKNNGIVFNIFQPVEVNGVGKYVYSFKRRGRASLA